jgi:hypothetical protein
MENATSAARRAAGKAQEVIGRVRPGSTEATRSLPIRCAPDEIRARWEQPQLRAAVLAGIPVRDAELRIGSEDRDWGRTATIDLTLDTAMPGVATNTLAGRALRRLKSLCETGEIPTTDHNPSARADAGEAAS